MATHLKCPKCASTDVGLCAGGAQGQYECMECGYIGPIGQRAPRKIKTLPD